ncbi:Coenzyme F420 hydrogenase/dehydrogenase, beta subunit C-terminal domain [Butyrivibrio sp. NC2007]|uniref:Coenzyme F420 hydrogenase/dehydrogenase, beta subunit C-terminal domain n=1 Tax=Butyrivibrio sp. NC2007 TaxID=1280683 RepID=UPI0003B5545F|nr:Coenzyme F420 hydrogenase/dehydrogenase, beta subunit C-terminal domain [Butyrivibrio sp. NC2007]
MADTYLDNNDISMCCGCSACADSCAVGAIDFEYGIDGSRYPHVDMTKCVSCGMCRNVCPINEKPAIPEPGFEKKAYALVLDSEQQRLRSASGGAFEAIATVLHNEYTDLMIAGAAWGDDLRVYHRLVSYDERAILKKSKYVQSNCKGIYREVKQKLNEGVHVLFTGTPCQLAALRNYLRKYYDNLFMVDLICHGVPGELIFDKYIRELNSKMDTKAVKATFRYKKKDLYGEVHSKYIRIEFDDGKVFEEQAKINPYLRGFHSGLFYRESCYSCKYANIERLGDITVGDYWRIQELNPEYVDYTGVSCLLLNTKKGLGLMDKMADCKVFETDVEALCKRNGQMVFPSKKHPSRDFFISKMDSESFEGLMDRCVKKESRYKLVLSAILPGKLKRSVKKLRKAR